MNVLETAPIYESVCRDLKYRPVATRIKLNIPEKSLHELRRETLLKFYYESLVKSPQIARISLGGLYE